MICLDECGSLTAAPAENNAMPKPRPPSAASLTGQSQPNLHHKAAMLFRAYDLAGNGWLSQGRMAPALSELALVVHNLDADHLSELLRTEPQATNAEARYYLHDFLALYDRLLRRCGDVERGSRKQQQQHACTRKPPQGAISSEELRAIFDAYCWVAVGTSRKLVEKTVQESCSHSTGINGSTCPHMNTAQLMRMCQDMDLIAGPGAPSFYASHATTNQNPRGSVSCSQIPVVEPPRASSIVGSIAAWQQDCDRQHGEMATRSQGHKEQEAPSSNGNLPTGGLVEEGGPELSFAASRTAVPDAPPLTRQDLDLIVARCKGVQRKLDFPRWLHVLAQLSHASGLDLFTLLTDHVRRLKAVARQQSLEQLAPPQPSASQPDHSPQQSLERAVRTMPLVNLHNQHQQQPTLPQHNHHQLQPLRPSSSQMSPPGSAHLSHPHTQNAGAFSFSAPQTQTHPILKPPLNPYVFYPTSAPLLLHSPRGTLHPLPSPFQPKPPHASNLQGKGRSKSASSPQTGTRPRTFRDIPHESVELSHEQAADILYGHSTPHSLSSFQINPLGSLKAPPRAPSGRSWSALRASHHARPTFSWRRRSAYSMGVPSEPGDYDPGGGWGGSGRFQGPRSLAASFPRPTSGQSGSILSRFGGSFLPGRAHSSFDPGWEVGKGGDGEGSGSGSGLLNRTHVGTDGGFSHAASRHSRYSSGTLGPITGVPSYASVNALRTLPPGNSPKLKRPAGVAAEVWGLPSIPLLRPTSSVSAPAAHTFSEHEGGELPGQNAAAATAAMVRGTAAPQTTADTASAATGGGKVAEDEDHIKRLVEEATEQAEEAILRKIAATEPHNWPRHKMLQAALVKVKQARMAKKQAEAAQSAPGPALTSQSAQPYKHSWLASKTQDADSPFQRAPLGAATPAAVNDDSQSESKPPAPYAPISTLQPATAPATLMRGGTQKRSSPTDSGPVETSGAAAVPPHATGDVKNAQAASVEAVAVEHCGGSQPADQGGAVVVEAGVGDAVAARDDAATAEHHNGSQPAEQGGAVGAEASVGDAVAARDDAAVAVLCDDSQPAEQREAAPADDGDATAAVAKAVASQQS